jgi:hypothetical protein
LYAYGDVFAYFRPGGWDVSWRIGIVVFEGWEGWEGAEAAAPQTALRLRAFLEPARGQRLPVVDVVHGDLDLSNVLARDGVITGIVEWDHVGVGSRALGLTSLLFDWQRLRLAHESALAPDGGERLVRRIVRVADEPGLRCTVAYGAIARPLSVQRGGGASPRPCVASRTRSSMNSAELIRPAVRLPARPCVCLNVEPLVARSRSRRERGSSV